MHYDDGQAVDAVIVAIEDARGVVGGCQGGQSVDIPQEYCTALTGHLLSVLVRPQGRHTEALVIVDVGIPHLDLGVTAVFAVLAATTQHFMHFAIVCL